MEKLTLLALIFLSTLALRAAEPEKNSDYSKLFVYDEQQVEQEMMQLNQLELLVQQDAQVDYQMVKSDFNLSADCDSQNAINLWYIPNQFKDSDDWLMCCGYVGVLGGLGLIVWAYWEYYKALS